MDVLRAFKIERVYHREVSQDNATVKPDPRIKVKTEMNTPAAPCPQTVEAALRLLTNLVEPAEQDRIAAMPESELILLHPGLGAWIREHFGLWKDNPALLQDSGQPHPDDASMVIIRRFWQQLREQRLRAGPTLH